MKLFKGDCLEEMQNIEDGSIDLILTDPPYGTIKTLKAKEKNYIKDNYWDVVIDINLMLKECKRILKPNGILILFSQQPYTTKLLNAVNGELKHIQTAIWLKNTHGNTLGCNKNLVNFFEEINIFYKKPDNSNNPLIPYFQKIKEFTKLTETTWKRKYNNWKMKHSLGIGKQFSIPTEETYNILIEDYKIKEMVGFIEYSELLELLKNYNEYKTFNKGLKGIKSNVFSYNKPKKSLHTTQKPVDLLVDLINTYSNDGEKVLDFTMGSGSTGVACIETNRRFIGIELDQNYFNIAKERINNELLK